MLYEVITETLQKTEVTDIAPTMSALLDISYPSGNIGEPLEFVFNWFE